MLFRSLFLSTWIDSKNRKNHLYFILLDKFIFYALLTLCAFDVPNAAMNISCDLTELGITPVAVVSAGVKSILDIPRTLEYLVLNHFLYKYFKRFQLRTEL